MTSMWQWRQKLKWTFYKSRNILRKHQKLEEPRKILQEIFLKKDSEKMALTILKAPNDKF